VKENICFSENLCIFHAWNKTTKQQNNKTTKRFSALLSVVLIFLSGSSFAFPKVVEIRNCYQQIMLDVSGEYNLLGGDFWFDKYATSEFNNFMTLKAFDANGLEVPLDLVNIGLTDGVTFPIHSSSEIFDFATQSVFYADVIDMRNSSNGAFNRNVVTLPSNVKSFEIIILNPDSDHEFSTVTKSTINLLKPEDAFSFSSSNERDCQTFDNFNMSYVNNLDGFCGSIKGKLRRLPSDITDPADPYNEIPFSFGSQKDLGPWAEHCPGPDWVIIIDPIPQDPVPWGCQTFIVDLVIEPCIQSPSWCEDLIISQEIEICCSCDVRTAPPAN